MPEKGLPLLVDLQAPEVNAPVRKDPTVLVGKVVAHHPHEANILAEGTRGEREVRGTPS